MPSIEEQRQRSAARLAALCDDVLSAEPRVAALPSDVGYGGWHRPALARYAEQQENVLAEQRSATASARTSIIQYMRQPEILPLAVRLLTPCF